MAIVRLASGVELELHAPGDYVSDVIRATGDHYEVRILEELRERLWHAPPGLIVDAGAHIGNHTTYLARTMPRHHVVALEPLPASRELLRRNVAGYPNVTDLGMALSDRAGPLTMREEVNLGHSRAHEDGGIVATALTLDELVGGQNLPMVLLKIDVEGHEPQVIAGARRTLERWRPLVLIEDWGRAYGPLLPGYRVAAEWELAHQTYLYEWAGG